MHALIPWLILLYFVIPNISTCNEWCSYFDCMTNMVPAFVTDESVQVQLQCVTTPDKGRGITSQYDIPEGSLVHSEEPYAVVLTLVHFVSPIMLTLVEF